MAAYRAECDAFETRRLERKVCSILTPIQCTCNAHPCRVKAAHEALRVVRRARESVEAAQQAKEDAEDRLKRVEEEVQHVVFTLL